MRQTKVGEQQKQTIHQKEINKKLNGIPSNSATVMEGLWSVVIASAAQHSIESGSKIDIDDYLEKKRLSWIINLRNNEHI